MAVLKGDFMKPTKIILLIVLSVVLCFGAMGSVYSYYNIAQQQTIAVASYSVNKQVQQKLKNLG